MFAKSVSIPRSSNPATARLHPAAPPAGEDTQHAAALLSKPKAVQRHTRYIDTSTLTEPEVWEELSRIDRVCSEVEERHRVLFDQYLALPEIPRDKIAANVVGTMHGLNGIVQTLNEVKVRLHGAGFHKDVQDIRIAPLSNEQLQDSLQDLFEAETELRYVRSRVDRINGAMERLKSPDSTLTR